MSQSFSFSLSLSFCLFLIHSCIHATWSIIWWIIQNNINLSSSPPMSWFLKNINNRCKLSNNMINRTSVRPFLIPSGKRKDKIGLGWEAWRKTYSFLQIPHISTTPSSRPTVKRLLDSVQMEKGTFLESETTFLIQNAMYERKDIGRISAEGVVFWEENRRESIMHVPKVEKNPVLTYSCKTKDDSFRSDSFYKLK